MLRMSRPRSKRAGSDQPTCMGSVLSIARPKSASPDRKTRCRGRPSTPQRKAGIWDKYSCDTAGQVAATERSSDHPDNTARGLAIGNGTLVEKSKSAWTAKSQRKDGR